MQTALELAFQRAESTLNKPLKGLLPQVRMTRTAPSGVRIRWSQDEIDRVQDETYNVCKKHGLFPLVVRSQLPTAFKEAQQNLIQHGEMEELRFREHLDGEMVKEWRELFNDRWRLEGPQRALEIDEVFRRSREADQAQSHQELQVVNVHEEAPEAPPQKITPVEALTLALNSIIDERLRGVAQTMEAAFLPIINDLSAEIHTLRRTVEVQAAEVKDLTEILDFLCSPEKKAEPAPAVETPAPGPLVTAIENFIAKPAVETHTHPDLPLSAPKVRLPRIAIVGLYPNWQRYLDGERDLVDITFLTGEERPLKFDLFHRVYMMAGNIAHRVSDATKRAARSADVPLVHINGSGHSQLRKELMKFIGELSAAR